MRKTTFQLTALLIVAMASATAVGQDAGDNPLRQFDFMLGQWEESHVAVSDTPELGVSKGEMLHSTLNTSLILNGSAIESVGAYTGDGEATVPTREIIYWDPVQQQIVHRFFGAGLFGGGTWKKVGDSMELTWKLNGPNGKTYAGKSIVTPIDKDAYSWQIVDAKTNGEDQPDSPLVRYQRPQEAPGPCQVKMQALEFLIGDWRIENADGTEDEATCRWLNRKAFIEFVWGDYREVYGWHPIEQRYYGIGFGTRGGIAELDVTQDGDTWRIKAKPLFYDQSGGGFVFGWDLNRIDDDTIECEMQFGSSRPKTTRRRVTSEATE